MQEFNKIFDSRFDSIFSRLLDKKYRIDLSKYGFNQYSFIDEQVFIMSNVIKKISDLIILIPNVEVDNYTIKLINMINTSNSVTDLYNMMDDYLIDKLIEKYRSKDKIVSYSILSLKKSLPFLLDFIHTISNHHFFNTNVRFLEMLSGLKPNFFQNQFPSPSGCKIISLSLYTSLTI